MKAEYEYSPFGGIIKQTGTAASDNPFRFSTKYFDDETGLSYYGYRYYDAEKGRWPSRDPINERGWRAMVGRFRSEEEVGLAEYGFVGNDPVRLYDYLGLVWEIVRQPRWAQGKARVRGDNVEALAQRIGLDANEYRERLESDDQALLPVNKSVTLWCRSFKIPNTVISYYAWRSAPVTYMIREKSRLRWVLANTYLRDLGFKTSIRNHRYGTSGALESAAESLSREKKLHGVYYLGHGSPDGQLWSDPDGGSWDVALNTATFRPDYKMGLGLFFGCHTAGNNNYSQFVSGIFHGKRGNWIVTRESSFVPNYIRPGDQATKLFRSPRP